MMKENKFQVLKKLIAKVQNNIKGIFRIKRNRKKRSEFNRKR